jgi:hypothetical protein
MTVAATGRRQLRTDSGASAPDSATFRVALDRLETLVRNRLERLQYRPHTLDGFIAGTGLTRGNPASP